MTTPPRHAVVHAYLGVESLTARCLDCGQTWTAVGHKLCRNTRRAIQIHIAQHRHTVTVDWANRGEHR